MAETYNRDQPAFSRSLPALRYRNDSQSINAHYWVSRLAEGGLASSLKSQDASDDPVLVLKQNDSVYGGKLGHDVTALRDRVTVSKTWRKLLVLVMISSALERYMTSVVRVAVAADPVCSPGFPKVVDGAQLLKHGLQLPAHDLRGLTVGTWGNRIAAYKEIFRTVPGKLEEAHVELEYLRKTRNQVAHALGVDDGYDRKNGDSDQGLLSVTLGFRQPTLLPRATVSDARLTKLMACAQEVVDAVDTHLLRDYIGGYEILALYHEWDIDKITFEKKAGIALTETKRRNADRFQNVLGGLFSTTRGTEYVSSVRRFFDQL